MKDLKEKSGLRKAIDRGMALADWLGGHLTGLLTIGSVVLAFLYTRERQEKQSLETDLELKDQVDKIKDIKEKVDEDQKEADEAGKTADSSYDAYQSAKRDYRKDK